MSLLNKYMHPRNIYKVPPDFKELAIAYPEFRSFAKQDITGKVIVDFKDPAMLRALTTTLLKKDFGLYVEIPPNRLVPTLPLRLNYLLWIEDLLSLVKDQSVPIRGIDIGTGATSIYSIIAAKSNKWEMLATEVDLQSCECAQRNINRNNLQDLVTVKHVDIGTVLRGAADDGTTYDFCMCNPPFFGSEEELNITEKSRSRTRPSPHNAPTGAIGEIVMEGGEVALISQMILESKEMKSKIRIYTTMVGRKSSILPLIDKLSKVDDVNLTQTEFCQGHTTRWGLAWTFVDNLNLDSGLPKTCSRKKQKKPPLKYIVPKTCPLEEYTISCVSTKLVGMLRTLELDCQEIQNDKHMTSYCLVAYVNTWSNQRRLRREALSIPAHDSLPVPDVITSTVKQNVSKRCFDDVDAEQTKLVKKVKVDNLAPGSPLLKAKLIVRKVSSEINVELSWIEGVCGRDAAHQVLQYIKNTLK